MSSSAYVSMRVYLASVTKHMTDVTYQYGHNRTPYIKKKQ